MFSQHTQRFSVALKVAIVFLAAGYIAWRFGHYKDTENIGQHLVNSMRISPLLFLAVFLLMPLNWMLEGLKWKIAAGQQLKISFATAMRGVLAGVTIGTATPNRVGEFAGRIFMAKETDRMPLLFLSFACSFCQVIVTFLAGIFGFQLLENRDIFSNKEMLFIYAAGVLFCCLPLLLPLLPAKLKENAKQLRSLPFLLFLQIFFLSAVRYAVYLLQFMLLVRIVRPEYFCPETCGCVMISYLVVTLIPTFSFTEVLVRGSIASLVFAQVADVGRLGFIVAVMLWAINVAIPSLVGSVFVFRLKFRQKE